MCGRPLPESGYGSERFVASLTEALSATGGWHWLHTSMAHLAQVCNRTRENEGWPMGRFWRTGDIEESRNEHGGSNSNGSPIGWTTAAGAGGIEVGDLAYRVIGDGVDVSKPAMVMVIHQNGDGADTVSLSASPGAVPATELFIVDGIEATEQFINYLSSGGGHGHVGPKHQDGSVVMASASGSDQAGGTAR